MKKLAIITCGFVAAIWLTACGGGDNLSLLTLQIKKVEASMTYGGADIKPDNEALLARVTVTGPGMDTVSKDAEIGYGGEGTLSLPQFPEGYDRQISFEFLGVADPLNANERPVIGRGRSASLDVWADGLRAPDRIFVSPVNSMVRPTIVNDDGIVVQSVPVHAKRVGATATELDDGRILICGGAEVRDGADTWYMPGDLYNLIDTCEMYNPRSGEFSELVHKMTVKRAYHQAVKLGSPDNPDGRVVLIGGYTIPDGGAIETTPLIDIFDPDTGMFLSATDGRGGEGLPGGAGRALFTADVINADRNLVIVLGGLSNYKAAGSTYDILWITEGAAIVVGHGPLGDNGTGSPIVRYNHGLARVQKFANAHTGGANYEAYLLVGGENNSGIVDTVEPYVITCDSREACKIQRQDSLIMPIQDGGRTMPALAYDKVHNFLFVIGGFKGVGATNPTARAEIYRVEEATFKNNEHLSLGAGVGAVAVSEMQDGKYLLTGGWNGTEFVDAVHVLSPRGPVLVDGRELETPAIKADVPAMESARAGHISITDQTGRVLLFGGVDNSNASPDPIMYNPAD